MIHYYRLNMLYPSGWHPSATGWFKSRADCGVLPATLEGAEQSCSAGAVTATFRWEPSVPRGFVQWVDLSLFGNGFAPGTFLGAGPLLPETESLVWHGLLAEARHYWRVNTLVDGQWVASGVGSFTTSCRPLGLQVSQECSATVPGTVKATFQWSPLAGVSEQWVDLTLFDNGFAAGTFLGAGPLPGDRKAFVWDGLLPGTTHFWRVNARSESGWIPSDTASFATRGDCGKPSLTVHFIDVGQGDAILVEVGDADILVDGGRSSPAVLSYLTARDVPDIDLMVATHPDADHIGGLDDVLAQYKVLEVWTNGATSTSQTYQDFAAAVAAEGAVERQIRRGYSTQVAGVTLTALHPTDPLTGDSNGDSIVLRLSCGSVDVLLTGDANSDSEASMLADPSLILDADVLKVGHHGSSTSTTNAFLDAVTPKDAVISVGAGNTYGHPAQETLNRLVAHGATVYRTDLDGTVVLTSDCSTYSISTAGATPTPEPTVAPTPSAVATPVPTATAVPPPPPTATAVVDCSRDQYNCGDFGTCAEVMAIFNACPGDPNRLDENHDGTPCESLCK
jgi:beta-lactamase superfamily II metal-dependent hydrolase